MPQQTHLFVATQRLSIGKYQLMPDKFRIAEQFKSLQDEICSALEQLDGKAKFIEDHWQRPGGGGGRSRVINHGDLLEKGGVNFSEVKGDLPAELVKEYKAENPGFFATGVSIVLHPNNPFVPIIHMNVRYFEMDSGLCWFGGGIDLTPHYVVPEDAVAFHRGLKTICDKYHPSFYPEHSAWADKYFSIPHRGETRGIGGIFFDQQKPGDLLSKQQLLDYCLELGRNFVPLYAEVANKHRYSNFTAENKQWQKLRRGRYVEFNLVWDRGTRFGLITGGRTESILMSLPQEAMWLYDYNPEPKSEEAQTLVYLRQPQSWLS
jgi:coproporphyrinogen III oxidase